MMSETGVELYLIQEDDISEKVHKALGSTIKIRGQLVGYLHPPLGYDSPSILLPVGSKESEVKTLSLIPSVARYAVNNYFEAAGRAAIDDNIGTFELYPSDSLNDSKDNAYYLEFDKD